ncbi:SPFH domain-containing protein, partial [uncultured Alistipes sp.]|uniref:SPFH domain-containing protein n=1 Tax=uncultured Alistipes sp. TaxID=538949 RepID=UPI00266D856C
MKDRNFVYDGWKANGFVALACELVLLAGFIALIVWGALRADALQPGGAWMIAGGAAGLLAVVIGLCGFMLLEPNEARVMVFFGNYRGTFYETGFWWVNPFMSAKPVSMRARNLNVDPIKVNDKTGNPILIGLVLVWRIKRDDIYKAVFEIDAAPAAPGQGVSASARMNVLQNFVNVQSDAALRQVAGCYAYDDNGVKGEALTLRSNSEEINEQLEAKLNERLAMAGIEVVEARINYLAYAPEIAAVMLRRQ